MKIVTKLLINKSIFNYVTERNGDTIWGLEGIDGRFENL